VALDLAGLHWLKEKHRLPLGPLSAASLLAKGAKPATESQRKDAHERMARDGLLDPATKPEALVSPFQSALRLALAANRRLTVTTVRGPSKSHGAFFGDGEAWVRAHADEGMLHLSPAMPHERLAHLLARIDGPDRPAAKPEPPSTSPQPDATLVVLASHFKLLKQLVLAGLSAGVAMPREAVLAVFKDGPQDPASVLDILLEDRLLSAKGKTVRASAEHAPWLGILATQVRVGLALEVAVEDGTEELSLDLLGPPGLRAVVAAVPMSELTGESTPAGQDDEPVVALERLLDEAVEERIRAFLCLEDEADEEA
jgi:hypothetical protein